MITEWWRDTTDSRDAIASKNIHKNDCDDECTDSTYEILLTLIPNRKEWNKFKTDYYIYYLSTVSIFVIYTQISS